ncbi:hypothetical protein HNP46_005709 [Pseudomonas nitritireducens]|uniref:Uncharacterized protein n=1 Tax=Pseudomonas nitroreducens TaxID=46680 RepID=A0A7W7KPX5_PSENT|nr:hypothetical protein [Pseudomonas nitritireducens]MBB4866802.1 hypothetical protein [Pseudomonas nitritireducens]
MSTKTISTYELQSSLLAALRHKESSDQDIARQMEKAVSLDLGIGPFMITALQGSKFESREDRLRIGERLIKHLLAFDAQDLMKSQMTRVSLAYNLIPCLTEETFKASFGPGGAFELDAVGYEDISSRTQSLQLPFALNEYNDSAENVKSLLEYLDGHSSVAEQVSARLKYTNPVVLAKIIEVPWVQKELLTHSRGHLSRSQLGQVPTLRFAAENRWYRDSDSAYMLSEAHKSQDKSLVKLVEETLLSDPRMHKPSALSSTGLVLQTFLEQKGFPEAKAVAISKAFIKKGDAKLKSLEKDISDSGPGL